jgi:peptidyl-prolyl cis-trans isomerase SurA
MKQLLWIVPAIFFSICAAEANDAKTVDRIIVQVNDDIITLSDLKHQMAEDYRGLESKYSGEELAQMKQKAEKQTLEKLIQNKLLDQKATELGPSSDVDSRVSAAIQQIIKENKLKTTDDLEKALIEQQGVTLRDFRDLIKKSIMRDDLIGSMVGSRIAILSQELEQYYKDHAADFTTPEEISLCEIDIPIKNNDQEAAAQANDIYSRLLKGEPFAILASQYSKGPAANKGGCIGTAQLNKLNAETINTIADLKAGDISKPQKQKSLYVIYRIDARKPATIRPLEEVRTDIKSQLWNQKYAPEYERFMTQLKENAYIQYFSEMK